MAWLLNGVVVTQQAEEPFSFLCFPLHKVSLLFEVVGAWQWAGGCVCHVTTVKGGPKGSCQAVVPRLVRSQDVTFCYLYRKPNLKSPPASLDLATLPHQDRLQAVTCMEGQPGNASAIAVLPPGPQRRFRATVVQMKDRLTRLIGQLDDESLLATALQLNDDAQVGIIQFIG